MAVKLGFSEQFDIWGEVFGDDASGWRFAIRRGRLVAARGKGETRTEAIERAITYGEAIAADAEATEAS